MTNTVSLIPIANLAAEPPPASAYVVFGGTFDPIHLGHVDVIRSLARCFSTTIVAPTAKNPWKHDEPEPTPLELRLEMIELVLAAEGITLSPTPLDKGVHVLRQGYVYAEEVVKELREKRSGRLYWAVAEDLADSVHEWRNWNQLDVPVAVLPIQHNIHATKIREGLEAIHPALQSFIVTKQLYPSYRVG